MKKTKKAVVAFSIGSLLVLASAPLAHAQGSIDFSGSVSMEMMVADGSPAPQVDLAGPTIPDFAPGGGAQVATPEPSTLGLLVAGGAALCRFGWRKRSS